MGTRKKAKPLSRNKKKAAESAYDKGAKCPGCGYPVAYDGDYCGECMCEEDGV